MVKEPSDFWVVDMSAVSMVLPTIVKIEKFSPMGFAMDTPWPLPYHGFSHRSHTFWVQWLLSWIPPWPLSYNEFSHRSHTLWVPWVFFHETPNCFPWAIGFKEILSMLENYDYDIVFSNNFHFHWYSLLFPHSLSLKLAVIKGQESLIGDDGSIWWNSGQCRCSFEKHK